MQISEPMKLEGQQDSEFRHLYAMPPYPTSLNYLNCSFDERSYSEYNRREFNASYTSPSLYRRQVPLARSIRGTETYTSSQALNHHQLKEFNTSHSRIDQALPQLPSLLADSTPGAPSQPHVPRPPNAFMLFRSDFLKKGIIPSHVERRQQNLSRIAGQCWNLLPAEEKEKWQESAAKVLMEHQKQNPDYKFTPAPRGSRRTKSKGQADADRDALDDEDRIRKIREEYTQIAGPTAIPARRRRARTQSRHVHKDKKTVSDDPQCRVAHVPLLHSTCSTPSLPSPGQASGQGPALPPFFPQYSVPHITAPRRPSTSLGFSTASPQPGNVSSRTGFYITRPSSAASSESGLSTYLRDLDITPTSASFRDISILSTPPMSTSLMTPTSSEQHFSDAVRDPLPFTALNRCGASSSELTCPPPHWDEDSDGSNSGSLLSALYSDDSFSSIVTPHNQQEYSIFEESYFPNVFGALMSEWELSHSLAEVDHTYAPREDSWISL